MAKKFGGSDQSTHKIGKVKAAVPGSKGGELAAKRSFDQMKVKASMGGEEKAGPHKSSGFGAPVNDGAGTRSRADAPPETVAMAAPKAELPAAVKAIEADVLPVPSADTKPINAEWGWDYARDAKLGRHGS